MIFKSHFCGHEIRTFLNFYTFLNVVSQDTLKRVNVCIKIRCQLRNKNQ